MRHRRLAWLRLSLITAMSALALPLLCACQQSTDKSGASNGLQPVDTDPSSGLSADQVVLSDPSAIQLHDICGPLLVYYSIHRALPIQLTDLIPYAMPDEPLNFVSPGSGKPYLYGQKGLQRSGSDKILIVADPEPSARHIRWCILMQPPKGNGTLALEVIGIPESIFGQYRPADQ